jgi:hypothetical protein
VRTSKKGVPRHLVRRNPERQKQFELESAIAELRTTGQWDSVLPEITLDVSKGMDTETLRKKYAPLLTAKQISIGLTSPRPNAALAAIKDVMDRAEGKPVETKEVRHKLEALSEEELEAVLRTKLQDLQNATIDVTPEKKEP